MSRRSRGGDEPKTKAAPVMAPRRQFCGACKRPIFVDTEAVVYAFGHAYHPEHAPEGSAAPRKPTPAGGGGTTRATTSGSSRAPTSGSASKIERLPGESDEDFKKRRRRERRAARKAAKG